jgi:hypothetical protein
MNIAGGSNPTENLDSTHIVTPIQISSTLFYPNIDLER